MQTEIPYTIVFGDPGGNVGVTLEDLRVMRINVSNTVESFAGLFP